MIVERKKNFGNRLRKLRLGFESGENKGLTLKKLAELSSVDFALISCVERGERNVGEHSLRKLAKALGLSAEETEEFVDEGLSAAGSKQVLDQFKEFPTHFLHVFPREIHSAFPNLKPSEIEDVVWSGGRDTPAPAGSCAAIPCGSQPDLMWRVADKWFAAAITIASGDTPTGAKANLAQKLKREAGEGAGQTEK